MKPVSYKLCFLFLFGILGLLAECHLTGICSTYCDVGGSGRALQCFINQNDTDFLANQLFPCAEGDFRTLRIALTQAAIGATLNLTLPSNILKLDIHAYGIAVETSVLNTNLLTLLLHCHGVFIKHNDFFSYFPNLKRVHATYLQSESLPVFSLNKHLEILNVHHSVLMNETGRLITRQFVGGLGELILLHWTDGDISGIASGAFIGTTSLSQASLKNNEINELINFAFEGLDNLIELSLSGNSISLSGSNAFSGLQSLTTIRLNRNPGFPISSLAPLRELMDIRIDEFSALSFPSSLFEQFPSLEFIRIRDARLHCDCGTEWLADLAMFGIQLDSTGAQCVSPVTSNGSSVADPALYSACPNISYHCFNKSIECQGGDWLRVDSKDTCNCTCPEPHIGYVYDPSTVHVGCADVDECENSVCEGTCTNTVGSFMCGCEEGFLFVGELSCQDIDECLVNNGNCTHNCSNAVGNYSCSCVAGFTMHGFTDCIDTDECRVNNGGCSQVCTNAVGSYSCSCEVGYSLSAANSSLCLAGAVSGSQFSSFNQPQFYLVVLFGLICLCLAVVLFVVLIVVCFCYRRKREHALPKPKVEAVSREKGDNELSEIGPHRSVEKRRVPSVATEKETQQSSETVFSNY